MTRAEVIAEARARGFTHAVTGGGLQPLEAWHPYGADGGVNDTPRLPFKWFGEWIEGDRVRDVPSRPIAPSSPFLLGVWSVERVA